jgi:hypothetical protein
MGGSGANKFDQLRNELARLKGTGTLEGAGPQYDSRGYDRVGGGPTAQFGNQPMSLNRTQAVPARPGASWEGKPNTPGFTDDPSASSNINRLMAERNMLLKQGYLDNDPLVIQISEAIRELNRY